MKKNKKQLIAIVVVIVLFIFLLIGATYAYFAVSTTNNFGTSSLVGEIGSKSTVTLSGTSASMSLNLTSSQMLNNGSDVVYYASASGATTTPTEVNVGGITVSGDGVFQCKYTINVTHSGTNDMYNAFNGMSTKSNNQLMILVNGEEYDWNDGFPSTITGVVPVTSSGTTNITAGLKFVNRASVNQTALAGTDISINMTVSDFTCTAIATDTTLASSNELYNVIKKEFVNNGLAKIYNGTGADSYANSVYYYSTPTKDSSEEATSLLNKWNVVYDNKCFQMYRTTEDGGVRMLYNGDYDSTNKCNTNRSTHDGIAGSTTDSNFDIGTYYYGTSYIHDSNGYKLAGTIKKADTCSFEYNDMSGSYTSTDPYCQYDDSMSTGAPYSGSIAGMYTCKSSSSTSYCNTLYLVGSTNFSVLYNYNEETGEETYDNNYTAKLYSINSSTRYNEIASGINYASNYNVAQGTDYYKSTQWDWNTRNTTAINGFNQESMLQTITISRNQGYYSSAISYHQSGTWKYFTMEGKTKINSSTDASSLVGQYYYSSYSSPSSVNYVYYLVSQISGDRFYAIYITTDRHTSLEDARYVTFGTGVTENNGIYTLTNPTTIDKATEWQTKYSTITNGMYACVGNQSSCAMPYKITQSTINYVNGSGYKLSKQYSNVNSNNYSFDSSNDKWVLDYSSIADFYNKSKGYPYAYIGLSSSSKEQIYIVKLSGNTLYYLRSRSSTSQDIKTLFTSLVSYRSKTQGTNDLVSLVNSFANGLDSTYLTNSNTCNDHAIVDYGIFNGDNSLTGVASYLKYNNYNNYKNLSCTNSTDNVTEPGVLPSAAELALINNKYALATGNAYWTISPSYEDYDVSYIKAVGTDGSLTNQNVSIAAGIRPVITLKSGTTYSSGTGTMNDPYMVTIPS